MGRKKILFLSNPLNKGGCERHLVTMLPLIYKKYDVELLILGHYKGDWAPILEAKGVKVTSLLDSGEDVFKSFFTKIIKYIKASWRLRKYFKDSVLALHCFLPAAYFAGNMASFFAFKRHIPLIMSRRSLNGYRRERKIFMVTEWLWHRKLRFACGNSLMITDQLREEGIPEEKIRCIHNGVPREAFEIDRSAQSGLRAKWGIPDHEKVVVCVANIYPFTKGHQDLIDACALLKKDHIRDVRFVCVGRDIHGEIQRLVAYAQKLGVADKIIFTGEQEDIKSFLAMANLAVFPSHSEGFSNSLLEKMAAGLAVVATDIGGNRDVMIHGQTGYLVPARSPEHLAYSLSILLKDAQLCRLLGDTAKNHVCTHFSIETCLEKYFDLYREILLQDQKVRRAHGKS